MVVSSKKEKELWKRWYRNGSNVQYTIIRHTAWSKKFHSINYECLSAKRLRVYMNSQYGFRSTLAESSTTATNTPCIRITRKKIINDFVNNLSYFIEVFIPWPPTVNTQHKIDMMSIWLLFFLFFICLWPAETDNPKILKSRMKQRYFDW